LCFRSDLDEKLKIVNEIRDYIEITFTAEYQGFLQHLMPSFLHVLQVLRPVNVDDKVHRIRNTILEILSRLPMTDVFRPYGSEVLSHVLRIVNEDNEDNALIALRIFSEVLRYFKTGFDNETQQFVQLVHKLYEQFPAAVARLFSTAAPAVSAGSGAGSLGDSGAPATKPHALESFKVLSECPSLVVTLLPQYSSIKEPVLRLCPFLMAALRAEAPADAFVTHRAAFFEYVLAQAKVRSPLRSGGAWL
jgi:transformation/transcription domain-associated protein